MSIERNERYDLFVIGGGINGAAVACDAAGRGLSVALAEERDFAEGTSSRSSKLIHGGLRYLETYDFRLVREALREREILMAKTPHLVWPIRLVLPHVPGLRPRWMIRLGLLLYDHLAPRKQLAASEAIEFAAQYLQLVLRLTPLQAGLATLPWSLAFVAGSLLAPRLTRRWAAGSILVCGLVAAACGFAALAFVEDHFAVPLLVASTVVMSLGLAPVFTIGNEMIITAAPPERAGAASALSETASELSGALGIAVLGSLGTMLYRATLAASLPGGVPAAAATDALATLGGAVAAASSLPGAVGDALVMAARAAFVDAMQVTAGACAAIVLLASIVAARILRNVGAPVPTQV